MTKENKEMLVLWESNDFKMYYVLKIDISQSGEVKNIYFFNKLFWKEYILNIERFKNDIILNLSSFQIGYFIINNREFLKVYMVTDDINKPVFVGDILKIRNFVQKQKYLRYKVIIMDKYIDKIINMLKKRKINKVARIKLFDGVSLILKKEKLSLVEQWYIFLESLSIGYRYYFSSLYKYPEDIRKVWSNEKLLEKLYGLWILTFPDILMLYIYWWINKERFLKYLDRVLDIKYLIYQLEDKKFYMISQNLIADKTEVKNFLSRCKILKECFNTLWNRRTRYNLYVRLIVISNLYKKWIIPEDKYEVYKKNIENVIKIIKEMDKLEKDKKNEKKKEIKKIKKQIDEFLNSVNVEKWYYYLNEKDSGEFFDRYK